MQQPSAPLRCNTTKERLMFATQRDAFENNPSGTHVLRIVDLIIALRNARFCSANDNNDDNRARVRYETHFTRSISDVKSY